jgi:teichuronic acid exporter
MNNSQLAKKGFLWSFIENFSKQGLHFFIGIILARLLSPADYGLIGICAVFIAIGNAFVDGGFGVALIRKNKCTDADYNTVFYFNIVVAILIYLLLFICSPFIADFFKNRELILIIRVLSLGSIFGSLSIIQRTILTKEINFKVQTKSTAIALLLSGIVGVSLAFLGYGVWSLVFQSLLLSLIGSVSLWYLNSWRPKLIFSKSSFKDLFMFGSNLLITDIINIVYKNAYYIVIGKFFSAASLGFFTRAETTVAMLTSNLTNTVKRVSYPVLAKLQDDEIGLKSMYKKLVKNTMLVAASLIFGLAATAKPLILLLIGEQWLPSVLYIQLLSFAGIFLPLTIFNLNAINVKGHSKLYLKLQLTNKVLGVPVIFIGIYWGIKEMLIGFIVVAFVYYLINAYFSSKLINYPVKEQLLDILPIIIVSGLVSCTIYTFSFLDLHFTVIFALQILSALFLTALLYNVLRFKEYLGLQDKLITQLKKIF